MVELAYLEADPISYYRLKKTFEAAGSSLDHAVKAQVFLTDLDDFHGFDSVWKRYFKVPPPRTTGTSASARPTTRSSSSNGSSSKHRSRASPVAAAECRTSSARPSAHRDVRRRAAGTLFRRVSGATLHGHPPAHCGGQAARAGEEH